MIVPKLYPFHSLLWAYNIWFRQTSLGIQLGHKMRPGHCNMQHWWFSSDWSCMCVSWSLVFLTSFYFRVIYCPTLRGCTPFTHVPYVCECPWEGLRNIRHLHEWGTSSEGAMWSILLQVSRLFSSLGEQSVNHGWLCSGEDVLQECFHIHSSKDHEILGQMKTFNQTCKINKTWIFSFVIL